jgi:riboflavin synthase
MFTGIVETAAEVLEVTDHSLTLRRPASFMDVVLGTSICTAGACLSAVRITPDTLGFDVVPETFARTSLGQLRPGSRVNLERSMRADSRFEGHIVQGHVEGVGEVVTNADPGDGTGWRLTFKVPEALLPCVIPKGSIAVDGVSLTVASIEQKICTIALIPHTLEVTTLGVLKSGDRVNLETDLFLRGLQHVRSLFLAR